MLRTQCRNVHMYVFGGLAGHARTCTPPRIHDATNWVLTGTTCMAPLSLFGSPLASSMAGGRVLELGAGMSGLAGLGLAACSRAAEVVITDGNPDALKNLEVGEFFHGCGARGCGARWCVVLFSGLSWMCACSGVMLSIKSAIDVDMILSD